MVNFRLMTELIYDALSDPGPRLEDKPLTDPNFAEKLKTWLKFVHTNA